MSVFRYAELYQDFEKFKLLDHDRYCNEECKDDGSGTGPRTTLETSEENKTNGNNDSNKTTPKTSEENQLKIDTKKSTLKTSEAVKTENKQSTIQLDHLSILSNQELKEIIKEASYILVMRNYTRNE